MAIVTVTNLTKAYGRRPPALVDVSLEFREGVTGLLGPNGAGKSTLLQCVLGLLRDFSGRATVLGLDARRQRLDIRRRVGYMPEADALLPRMSGVASCRFLAQLSGLSRREALRRAHECLHYVGLTEHLYKSAEEYSTGMRQRLKLAQAIVHDPDVLFLDEPVSGMDPQGREDFLALVRGLAKEHGKHVIWSSHMLPDVQRVADGILVLQGGHVRGSFRLEDLEGATGRFDVEGEGHAMPFLDALATRGVRVEPEDATPGALDPTSLRFRRIVQPPGGDAGPVFEAAHATATILRAVTPVVERLEDVFHRLIDGGRMQRPETLTLPAAGPGAEAAR
ncbi:MAG: ABC transporter ATP-binding protein [Planctomycetia bacterium]|nr:ABC transporter ATP-binding protein [Planctomycetia bacterium]